MFFNSYSIFIYIVLVIACYAAVRFSIKNVNARSIFLLAINVFILLSIVMEHSIIVLGFLGIIVFGFGYLLQKRKIKWLLALLITILITLFIIRNYPFVHELLNAYLKSWMITPILSVQKIGISYILFRFVHYLVESYKGKIHRANLLSFLNYIFFFPSFLAGPIDQYNNFHYWLSNTKHTYQRQLFFAGIFRVFIGAVKTLLVVPLVINYAVDYSILLPAFPPIVALLLSLLAYSAYIYFDFSGYSDIAIGTGYMLGIRTPENFNNPYISSNLSEFWKRWHMTFSFFLRIYVFKPFIHLFNSIINPKHRLLVTILAYLFTFTICGLWHGDTVNFIYWGLWHGIGLAFYKVWTSKIKPQFRFRETVIYNSLGTAITFVYVTIGWLFFHYKTDKLSEIFNLII